MSRAWLSPLLAAGLGVSLTLSSLIAAAVTHATSAVSIPYPNPRPTEGPLVFLPDLISRPGSLEFNAAFSPDGQSFYFATSVRGQWDIQVARYQEGAWGAPAKAEFSDERFSEADPVFSPDGRLYFISNRPKSGSGKSGDFDIWFVSQLANGEWSAPQNATALNSPSDEYYISFSKAGDAYFGSDRPGGFGSMDIYVSRHTREGFLAPENLGPTINTAESEHDPCLISEDDRLLVFKSENRPDGQGSADLYVSRRGHDGRWTPAVNLGRPFNTPGYEYCAYVTPDGQFFFYSSELDIKWIAAPALRRHIESLMARITPSPSIP